jgi:hypothetical protein
MLRSSTNSDSRKLIADSCCLLPRHVLWEPESSVETPAAHLTVERASPDDVRQRQIVVTLDGHPFGTLLFGEIVTRDIAAGHHRLRAHNTLLWRTVEFYVGPGESVRFSTVNRAGRGTMGLIMLLGVGPLYVTLERVPEPVQPKAER